jgi:hypothetical protein
MIPVFQKGPKFGRYGHGCVLRSNRMENIVPALR